MVAYLRPLLVPLPILLLVSSAVAADTDRFGDALPPNAVARIGSARLHHGGAITAIAFAADSKMLATTSADHTVSVWETATGRELLRCDFDHPPHAAAFTKDGKALLCVADGGAHVFEIGELEDKTRPATPKELRQFSLKTDKITTAAFSTDATWLAVGDEDGRVRLWDVKEGQVLTDFSMEGRVRCVAVSREAKLIAATTGINGIQTWDTTKGEKQQSFGKGAYSSLAFAAAGTELAAGNFDNEVSVFDPAKGMLLSSFVAGKEVSPVSKNGIASVMYSVDGQLFASGAGDGSVRAWRRTGKNTAKEATFESHTDRVTAVALSPDGKWLVSGGADNTIRLYHTTTWKEQPLPPQPTPQAPLANLALSPDGKFVITLDAPLGRLMVWDAHIGKPSQHFQDLPSKAGAVAFTPDGKTLAIGSSGREVRFWDVEKGQKRDSWNLAEIEGDQAVLHTAVGMLYDGAGKRLALPTGQGYHLAVYDGGKRLALFIASGGSRAGCLSFSPDGSTLASCGPEAAVRLWDVDHNTEKGQLLGHSGGTLAVAFSPNGRMIASGGKDRMIRVWEVATGKQRQAFGGQPGWVRAVAFAPDGTALATANTDGIVRLWDLATGKLLHELTGHRGTVTRLAFSARGDVLASASADATVLMWDTAKLLKDHKVAVINLTPKQLARAWDQIASTDVGTASAAMQTLARAPAQTVPLLREHVQPLKAGRLAQLLKDLDNDTFAVRDAAAKELAAAGKFAEPVLKATLKGEPSVEVRRSVEELLEKLRERGPSPEELRMLRSLEILEMIGGEEAKKILMRVAEEGGKDLEPTRQARAALERLAKHAP